MRKYNELLDIVDENDQVIGHDTRDNIHKLGLLHREVCVWIYNDKKEIVFQRRSPDKDLYPNLLDASAGGHVGLGMDYETAAAKELKEETGIKASKGDLVFLKMTRKKDYDEATGNINNLIRAVYLYKIKPNQTLSLEHGMATGFEFYSIDKLKSLSESERRQFTPIPLAEAIELNLP